MIWKLVKTLILLIIGIGLGAYLFSDTQKREFFEIKNCERGCFDLQETAGLLVSAGILKTSL